MNLEAPPSRYSVVERDRRLVVLDRETMPITETRPRGEVLSRRRGLFVENTITTHRLFDAHGPRRIVLTPERARIAKVAMAGAALAVIGTIALSIASPGAAIVLLVLAGTKKARANVRDQVTRWLDAAEAQATKSAIQPAA